MTVRFWNVSASVPLHTCSGHRNHILMVAWSPDGRTFVSADKSGEIRVWDPKKGTQRGSTMAGHKKWVTSLCFEPLHVNPACLRLASSSKDHTIKIWNVVTCQCETTISGHLDSVESVKWGGNGLLYTCSRDRTIKVKVSCIMFVIFMIVRMIFIKIYYSDYVVVDDGYCCCR